MRENTTEARLSALRQDSAVLSPEDFPAPANGYPLASEFLSLLMKVPVTALTPSTILIYGSFFLSIL